MDTKSTKKKTDKKVCSNWLKFGDCNLKENCHFLHADCENFTKFQKCSNSNCGFYHRRMCSNWKKDGKCTKANCNFLHNSCDKDCDETICPFFHNTFNKNIEDLLEGFRQKCFSCFENGLLVYLNCGDNCFCEKCAKNLIKEGKCKVCNENINDYIC